MNLVFARTRHWYASYQDLWEMVTLSGFEQCFIDEIRLDKNASYIFSPMNGEVPPHLKNERDRVGDGKRARVVWWMLERPDDADSVIKFRSDVLSKLHEKVVDEVWVSDAGIAAVLGSAVRFVPMGSHPGLAKVKLQNGPKKYDLAYMAAPTGRRFDAWGRMQNAGLSAAPNGWGVERSTILRQSRLLLNVHKDRWNFTEPLRLAVAAAHQIPVLTEECANLDPLKEGLEIVSAPLHRLADKAKEMLDDSWALEQLGVSLYTRLCAQSPFRTRVVVAAREMA